MVNQSDRWLSPLRYPGGKARMAGWVAEVFWAQHSDMDIEVWLEPFAGGAGAALSAPTEHGVPEAWLVEANPALAAFWTAVVTDGEALARRVETTVPTLSAFDAARETVAAAAAGEDVPPLEAGFAAFLINRCSRSGIVTPSVGPIGGKAQAGRWTVASRFNGPALAARVRAIAALGGRLRVISGDGIAHLESLDGSGIEDEVFAFVDPPYIAEGNRLYANGMSAADHARLAAALRHCPAPWVLTYDAHPAVLELYAGHAVMEFEIPHTANRQRIDTEYAVLSAGLHLATGAHPLGRGRHWWVESTSAPAAA